MQRYIPEAAEVYVSNIYFNTPVYISDLNVFGDENITVLHEPNELVATLVQAAEEETTEDEEISPDEVPVVGEEEEE